MKPEQEHNKKMIEYIFGSGFYEHIQAKQKRRTLKPKESLKVFYYKQKHSFPLYLYILMLALIGLIPLVILVYCYSRFLTF